MISVIIPVYNAEHYVAEAIESVLAQSLQPQEIIVINDGSTDGSLAVLKEFLPHIKLLSRENKGLAATLNEGIVLATQPLLAFLDADDLWLPDKLQKQTTCLDENPHMNGCFGFMASFISPELDEEVKQSIYCPPEPLPGNMTKITLLIRRTAFNQIGLFDPQDPLGYPEWIVRAQRENFSYKILPDVLSRRRLHRSGMSSQPSYKRDLIRLMKVNLDRKRKGNG